MQNCAINAEQKSNQCVGAIAPTDTRPLRGVQSLEKGGRSASATIALEAEKARHSPCLPKRPNGLQAKRSKKAALYLFRGFSERGEGKPPFLFAQTRDSKKLENIRENAILRNLESTESSVEILKNEKTQNLGSTESKVDSKTITESNNQRICRI